MTMNKVKKINNMRTWNNRVKIFIKVLVMQDLIKNQFINLIKLLSTKQNLFFLRLRWEIRICLLASSRAMMQPLSTNTLLNQSMTTTLTSSLTTEALLLHHQSSKYPENKIKFRTQQKRITQMRINIQLHKRIQNNLLASNPHLCQHAKQLSLTPSLPPRSWTTSSSRVSISTIQ